MKAMQRAVAQRRTRSVLRLVAAGSLAATLAGCYYQTEAQQNAYPTDYRVRHPITVHEGVQSVEVLIGRNRGGLTPSQRADVLAFAQPGGTKQAAASSSTSRKVGPPITRRQTRSAKSVRFSAPSASRLARSTCGATSLRDPRSPASSSITRNSSRRRVRAGSGLAISDRPTNPALRKTSLTGISAVPRNAIWHPWSTTRPTSFSRGEKSPPGHRGATQLSIIGVKAKTRPAITLDLTSAKSPI